MATVDLHPALARARPAAPALPGIAAAGLLVGALDFLACSLFWGLRGVSPERIARSLGELTLGAAAADGAAGVFAGLLLEAAMGMAMVAAYLAALRALPRLGARPVRNGLAFGALAYAAFEWIVVPLSAAAPRTPAPDWQLALLAIYMLVLGVPTALLAARLRSRPRR